ncbi:MAG: SOS response-associated peptidase [Deltaproteobacteria bacterium]|nr:SOS response-associated peptidase [Deltaproteobacteria bacterium]
MCGRFSLSVTPEALARFVALFALPAFGPRYNIAPLQAVGTIRLRAGKRTWQEVRWGIPAPPGNRFPRPVINARAETLLSSPFFRTAVRSGRCLVPADGFYEWRAEGRRRVPVLFRRPGGEPFAIAALADRRPEGEATVEACALVTCAPNAVVAPIHDRMPAILDPDAFETWLDPGVPSAVAARLLGPAPDALLAPFPVSSRVNDAHHEGADLWIPDPVRPGPA